MARELFIRNSRLLKKPLSMSDIVSGHKWSYGTLDDHGRLDKGKIDNNGPLIIYDTENIGRGIQILDHDSSKEIHLALVLPATEGDVRMLYDVAKRIAELWKSKQISVDGDKEDVSNLDHCIDFDIKTHKSVLRNARQIFNGSEYLNLACATLPVCISIEQLENFADDYNEFGHYLHEKQMISAYKSAPLFAQLDDVICSIYVFFDNGEIILPKEPEMKFTQDGEIYTCEESYIFIHDLFEGEKMSKMRFRDFVGRVPSEKKTEFDYRHILINPLTSEELQAIFKE
ncbi:MAG: DUF4299 family protein [Bacteroidales bacterium]|nr:DUF4299 family protein [Bacteroidales bacterium]